MQEQICSISRKVETKNQVEMLGIKSVTEAKNALNLSINCTSPGENPELKICHWKFPKLKSKEKIMEQNIQE